MARTGHRAVIAGIVVAALTLASPVLAGVPVSPRIALVESAGLSSRPGLARDVHDSFVHAATSVGFRPAVFVLGPGQDPLSEIGRVVNQRFDLIVLALATPSVPQIVQDAASAFPRARLLVPDLDTSALARPAPNVEGYVFRVEEPSYLAGYLAASMSASAPGRHTISAVGGVPLPVVRRFIVGYSAGARAAAPTTRVLANYSYDFSATPKCRNLALQQIALGSSTVFDVAGACREGALQVAIRRGVWGIGVDFDRASLGPRILTAWSNTRASRSGSSCRPSSRGDWQPGRRIRWACAKERSASGSSVRPCQPDSCAASPSCASRSPRAGCGWQLPELPAGPTGHGYPDKAVAERDRRRSDHPRREAPLDVEVVRVEPRHDAAVIDAPDGVRTRLRAPRA